MMEFKQHGVFLIHIQPNRITVLRYPLLRAPLELNSWNYNVWKWSADVGVEFIYRYNTGLHLRADCALCISDKQNEEPKKPQKLGKFGKDPGVETSFLPDRYDYCTCPHHLTFMWMRVGDWYLLCSWMKLSFTPTCDFVVDFLQTISRIVFPHLQVDQLCLL